MARVPRSQSVFSWSERLYWAFDRRIRLGSLAYSILSVLSGSSRPPGLYDVKPGSIHPPGNRGGDLLVPIHYRTEQIELRLFSTFATIGAPYDVTLEELRIETFFPVDAASEAALRHLTT